MENQEYFVGTLSKSEVDKLWMQAKDIYDFARLIEKETRRDERR